MALRDLVRHNIWLKLVSLVLAVLIWFAIKSEQKETRLADTPVLNSVQDRTVHVPVLVMTQPGDARVFKVEPETVILTVRGEDARLRRLTPRDFKVYVDMTDAGGLDSPSQLLHWHVPEGVSVLRLSQTAVTIGKVSP